MEMTADERREQFGKWLMEKGHSAFDSAQMINSLDRGYLPERLQRRWREQDVENLLEIDSLDDVNLIALLVTFIGASETEHAVDEYLDFINDSINQQKTVFSPKNEE